MLTLKIQVSKRRSPTVLPVRVPLRVTALWSKYTPPKPPIKDSNKRTPGGGRGTLCLNYEIHLCNESLSMRCDKLGDTFVCLFNVV